VTYYKKCCVYLIFIDCFIWLMFILKKNIDSNSSLQKFNSSTYWFFSSPIYLYIIYLLPQIISEFWHYFPKSCPLGLYVKYWPISKRGNKWEMLSYDAWTDGRTAVCHNKPVFWRAYKNEWPISWNYEYIIFGHFRILTLFSKKLPIRSLC
jgi:hypothetical protein